MGATNRGWPLPEQATQPPDVVKWLTDGLSAADADESTNVAAIKAVNNRLLYGPIASLPASMPPGTIYFGW